MIAPSRAEVLAVYLKEFTMLLRAQRLLMGRSILQKRANLK